MTPGMRSYANSQPNHMHPALHAPITLDLPGRGPVIEVRLPKARNKGVNHYQFDTGTRGTLQ